MFVKYKWKKKNKNKADSGEVTSDEVVFERGSSKSGIGDGMTSNQSPKEIDSPAFYGEKCPENDPPSKGAASLYASNMYGCHRDPNVHNGITSTSCKHSNMTKQGPEQVGNNRFTKDQLESLSFRHLSQCKSCEAMNTVPFKVEDCNSSHNENTKPGDQYSSVCKVHSITARNEFKSNNLASQPGAMNKTSRHPHFQKGKENSHIVWQKSQKNVREAQIHGSKGSNRNYVEGNLTCLQKIFWAKHNSFSGDGLLPSPLISTSRHNYAAHGIEKMENRGPLMYRGIYDKVLAESSECATRRMLNRSHSQYTKSNQVGVRETTDCDQLKWNSNHSLMGEYNCITKKVQGNCGEDSFMFRYEPVSSQKESLQVPFEQHHDENRYAAPRTICNSQNGSHYLNFPASSAQVLQNVPCSTEFSVKVQGGGFKSYHGMKIPTMNHVSGRPFRASVDSQPYSGVKLHNEYKFRKDVTSGANAKKWVPVGMKSRIPESTLFAGTCKVVYDNLQFSCKGANDSHPKGNKSPVCGPATLSDSKSTCSTPIHKMTSLESEASIETASAVIEVQNADSAKECVSYRQQPKDVHQFVIGSQMAAEALNDAYKLQLACEHVEVATSSPLAEFERLLCSAAPVIASSYIYEKCSACLDNQLSRTSLCKHQIPNISLRAVWNWYEKPGNYGLEIKADDSQNLKGLLSETKSFHAYFVPFLSAIQLFGHPNLSNCCSRSSEQINPEIEEKQDLEMHSCSRKTFVLPHSLEALEVNHLFPDDTTLVQNSDLVKDPIISSNKVSPCDGGDSLSLHSSPICFSDPEVIFEFFESDLPQQRRPLHDKIAELIDAGTSNLQVYGDPSKLQSLNLHDLHPASWFSVAWYPIYRIPEGNFRASFLTYHSLGHMVQRCVSNDSLNKNAFCLVSPVLGLQSYNAQGECWFNLRMPVKSILKESSPFNGPEILREQLRTLEENASLFARSCICKNNVKVFNRHPDYEFFISRKN